MKLPRRNFLRLAAGAAALPMASRIAWAQAYPSRPVRIIRFGTTPLPQKRPVAPIFIADSVSLAGSREKDGKLRIAYDGWWGPNAIRSIEAARVHRVAQRRGGSVAARGAFAGAIRSTPRCPNG